MPDGGNNVYIDTRNSFAGIPIYKNTLLCTYTTLSIIAPKQSRLLKFRIFWDFSKSILISNVTPLKQLIKVGFARKPDKNSRVSTSYYYYSSQWVNSS